MDLRGKVAVVTGGCSGIGQGVVLKLALDGAQVSIFDNASCDKSLELLEKHGVTADVYSVDVARVDQVMSSFALIKDKYHRLDILVNCAGINHDAMLHKMILEQWNDVIRVDLNGTFYCTQQAIKIMRPQQYGRIVNIASGSWLGNIGQANYAAAKAGVVGLTKTAARENARLGITCNVICPGFIETPMTLKLKTIKDGQPWADMEKRIPMGYAGKPADVANLVAFLVSDEAAYITSEVINVGGGMIV